MPRAGATGAREGSSRPLVAEQRRLKRSWPSPIGYPAASTWRRREPRGEPRIESLQQHNVRTLGSGGGIPNGNLVPPTHIQPCPARASIRCHMITDIVASTVFPWRLVNE
jgi:hypothetical protein